MSRPKKNFPKPTDLLPHEGDMVFINEIHSHSPTTIECSFIWDAASPYSDVEGKLPPSLLIEIAAQATGLQARLDESTKGEKPQVGYLVAINNVELPTSPLPSGQKYNINIKNTWKDKNFGIFLATITDSQNKPIFSGQLQLLQPNREGS